MNTKQHELMNQVTEEIREIYPPFAMKLLRERGTSADVEILIPEDDDESLEVEEILAKKLEQILVDYGYHFNCFPRLIGIVS